MQNLIPMPTQEEAQPTLDTKMKQVLHISPASDLSIEGSKLKTPLWEPIQLVQEKTNNNSIAEIEGQSGSGGLEPGQAEPKDEIRISDLRDKWPNLEVRYSDIKVATNNLCESSEVGKGGYGTVYKGKLGGKMMAIKILDSTSKQGEEEFFREVEVLYGMQHPNLVRLVGACFEVHALVYEFLPNGSLEDCLKYNPNLLTWQMRTRIIHEICSALIYLHSRSVVHVNLKPANVLLDANFKSKLSDFGLCRSLPEDMTTTAYLETVPKGTSGYIDPWFMETWILRPGSNLYSFGITILRLLTGMKPVGLGVKVRDADENSLQEMIDPTAGSWPFVLAKELAYWSLQCCYHNEKSQELLEDMSTCLKDMLAEIATLQEGRFKPNQSGSRGLEPCCHNKDSEDKISEGGQAEPKDESRISNLRDKWSSLEVLYSDIKVATNNLCESSKVGKGGYGTVYKGKLGGKMMAIKILDSTSKQGQQEFFQELEVLYGMRHPNLVTLTGACFEVYALVYEFLPHGSLEDCLKYNPNLLTWQMRTRIICEICSALTYLHSNSVVHGDLKPANILLDENFKSKLSDFGLCRVLPEDMTIAAYLETVPKGTSGYIDPWFMETWILRPGSDLYSLGITILKLLTGMKPVGLGIKVRDADETSLRKMIDPTAGSWSFVMAKELAYWSLQCCYHNENSSKLLEDMSICLKDMLVEIETLEGRFQT